MARTSDYVEAPYQGVSQAPAQVRLDEQASAIGNSMLAVPSGAQKRPPLNWMAQLNGPSTDTLNETYIAKDVGEFLFTVENVGGTVTPRLYSLAGLPSASAISPVAVSISADAQTYLNSGNPTPDEDLVLLTVEDYTFILNRKVPVGNGASLSPARPYEAMIWVRTADYARKYEIDVTWNGGANTYHIELLTPTGKDPEDGQDVDTDVIARGLFYGPTVAPYPKSSTGAANGAYVNGQLSDLTAQGFTVSIVAGTLYLSRASGDFTVAVKDGQGGEAMIAIKDRISSISDLPARVPVSGFTVRLTNSTGNPEDDYFMRFSQTAGPGTGVWEETIAPNTNLGVNPKTMPVGLVYNQGLGTWSIGVLAWTGRTVGDATLSPDPGFIGLPLEDIVFWRGRIGLLYSEGIRMTSASDPLRVYPSTLTTVLADDAYEHTNPLTLQAKFRHAVPFKRVLVLWGATGQAQVQSNGEVLTPNTSICEPYAYYESSEHCRPQGSNDRVYFAANRGTSASIIYEMEISRNSASGEAEGDDLTVSVPRYVPFGINRATTCAVNYLTVYGKSGDTTIYPHLYRYTNRERVQNAWSKWDLPEGCTYAGSIFVNTRLYVLVKRAGQVHLLLLDVADGVVDDNGVFLFSLDYKIDETLLSGVTYHADDDTTTVLLPYVPKTEPVFVVSSSGSQAGPVFEGGPLDAPIGTEAEVVSWSDSSSLVTLEGKWDDVPLFIGENYTGAIELSRLYYRDPRGRPNRTGRMTLRKITFDLDRALYLKVGIRAGGRDEAFYIFETPLADTPGQLTDEASLYSGPWAVPLQSGSEDVVITVYMDQWHPAALLGFTWEGEVNPKAERMQGR